MVKEFLSRKGIAYTERDVANDRAAAAEVVHLTGQMAVPVTIIDGQTVVGFDQPKLERLLAASPRQPSLGAAVGDAARITELKGLPYSTGAFVGTVKGGSFAQRVGLAAGDIITEINGQPVRNAEELERAVKAISPGSQVRVSFSRQGTPLSGAGVI